MSTAQTVIDSVRRLVHSELPPAVGSLRWSDAELLAWVNEAQREIVHLKPEANPVTAAHTVTTDSARQRISGTLYDKLIRVEGHVTQGVTSPPQILTPTPGFNSAMGTYNDDNDRTITVSFAAGDDINLARYPVVVVAVWMRSDTTGVHGITTPTVTYGGVAGIAHLQDYDDGSNAYTLVVGVIPLHGATLVGTTAVFTFEVAAGLTNAPAMGVVVYDVDPAYTQPFDTASLFALASPVDGTSTLASVPAASLVLTFAIGAPVTGTISGTSGAYTNSVNSAFLVDTAMRAAYKKFTVAQATPEQITGTGAFYLSLTMVFRGATTASTMGAGIRICERDVIDTFYPDWATDPGVHGDLINDANRYQLYIMDESDPLAFWLFPYPASGVDVVVTAAGIPATLAAVGSTLTLSDMYLPQLVDYVAYRAMSKDALSEPVHQLSMACYNRFLAALGAQRQIVRGLGQNVNRPPQAEE